MEERWKAAREGMVGGAAVTAGGAVEWEFGGSVDEIMEVGMSGLVDSMLLSYGMFMKGGWVWREW